MWSRTKRKWRSLSLIASCTAVGACADATQDVMTEPEVTPPGGVSTAAALTGNGYTPVIGNDWSAYSSRADLKAADLFWWWRSGDPNDQLDIVSDPTFGKALRVTFAQSTEYDYVPKMSADLPTPLDKMWYRFRVKWEPGFTTVASEPAGWANSYKLAFWLWDGAESRGQIEFSNTDEYIIGASVSINGTYQNYSEQPLPGSTSWGRVTTEWSDKEWWEYVAYWEKTGATTARQHIWRRRLTNNGTIANNPWTYWGVQLSGATTPRVRGIQLGGNKNKVNPKTMYMYLGRWEVVDGSKYPNPFNMPNISGGTPQPTPTLSSISISPDSASIQTGGNVQFQTTGRMSDGSTSSVTVAYSATGGSVSSSGRYTAPNSAGTYQVIARHASGLADTARVRVTSAPTAPTLTSIRISPDSATLQPGGKQQFNVSGRMSDGSTSAVTVTYSASGGSITSTGSYTAPSSTGTYRVIARHQSGLADTAQVRVGAQSGPTLQGVHLTPYRVTVAPGATTQFKAVGMMSDGTNATVPITYSTNGGSITSAGVHTAATRAGTYQVFAVSGAFADTSTVIVEGTAPTPSPTVSGLTISPTSVDLQTGAQRTFTATARYSDGSSSTVSPTWSATGGTITNAGVYTAPGNAGTYTVNASFSGVSASATVRVTAPTTPPPGGAYTTVAGTDWRSFADNAAMQRAGLFRWSDARNVNSYVDLVSDPVFGKVARVTQPGGTTATPQMHKALPTSMNKMWLRYRVKFSSRWTPNGSGSGPAHFMLAQWNWGSHLRFGGLDIQNTSYIPQFSVKDRRTNGWVRFNESSLSPDWTLGSITDEWNSQEWYEFVVYYEKLSDTSARQHLWKRKLTSNGQVTNGPWQYAGLQATSAPVPNIASITFGAEKNRVTPSTQHVFWGPWEVVDGSRYNNPWGMPNQ